MIQKTSSSLAYLRGDKYICDEQIKKTEKSKSHGKIMKKIDIKREKHTEKRVYIDIAIYNKIMKFGQKHNIRGFGLALLTYIEEMEAKI